jgi:hypothetical protein
MGTPSSRTSSRGASGAPAPHPHTLADTAHASATIRRDHAPLHRISASVAVCISATAQQQRVCPGATGADTAPIGRHRAPGLSRECPGTAPETVPGQTRAAIAVVIGRIARPIRRRGAAFDLHQARVAARRASRACLTEQRRTDGDSDRQAARAARSGGAAARRCRGRGSSAGGRRRADCAHDGQPAGHPEAVDLLEMVDDEHVRVSFHNGTLGDEEKTISIVACSQPPFWHDTLSPTFTEHAKYKKLAAPPKSASAEPPSGQVAGALSMWLSTAEGGGYIQIQKCYVTARWVDLAVGSRHTGRRASTACVVGVPARDEPKTFEACLVLRGACEQKYLGGGRYAACSYEASTDDPEKIDCGLVK